jgi:pantothenate kinase
VYAPAFHRDIEEPVAGSIEVLPSVRLVVTEGNYLLLPDEPWDEVRTLLHEAWFLDLDAELRLRRLTARHEAYGRPSAGPGPGRTARTSGTRPGGRYGAPGGPGGPAGRPTGGGLTGVC